MIEFVVLRHGQSQGDIDQVHEGRADLPLTDLGRQQARLAADWIAEHLPPECLYASTLRRAAETAEILAARLRMPLEYEEDLMEFNNGLIAGLPFAEAEERYPDPVGGYKPHEPVPGGESDIAFRARAEMVWSRIVSGAGEARRVGIVAHGGIISQLFRCFLNLPMQSTVHLVTGDTGIHLWGVDEAERCVLFTNRSDHLVPSGGNRNW